jgi:ribosomal protein S18 acetylase RimI-like enzyme
LIARDPANLAVPAGERRDVALQRRPIGAGDLPFLEALYASTRAEELAPVPWSDEEKTAFLRQQFAAQHAHYQEHYPGAAFDLLESDGQAIGRLYVARGPREIRVVDIALAPGHRGRGLGTELLRELQEEGHRSGRPVTVHVERNNPALRLYARLGFSLREDKGIHLFLEWSPAGRGRTRP